MWRLIPKARPCRPHRPTVSSHVRRAVRTATAAASQQVTGSLCGHGSSSRSLSDPLPRAAPDPDSSGDVSSSSLPLSASGAGCGRQVSSRYRRSAPPDAAAAAAATAAGIGGRRCGGPAGFAASEQGGGGKDLGDRESSVEVEVATKRRMRGKISNMLLFCEGFCKLQLSQAGLFCQQMILVENKYSFLTIYYQR